jgi:hypothetical protein
MGRILALLAKAVVLASAASFLGILGVLAVLAFKGYLNSNRLWDVLAAAYGVEQHPPAQTDSQNAAGIAYEELVQRRALAALDLDLRQRALDKAMDDLIARQARLAEERARYNRLVEEFEQRLAALQAGASDRTIQEVKQTLMVMQPDQAKAQLLKMWEGNQKDAVIAILKGLPPESLKRILKEFTEADTDQLYQLLKSILEGSGEGDLIRSMGEQIEQFKKSQP